MSLAAQRRKLAMKRFLSYRLPDVTEQNIFSSETDISKRGSSDSPFTIGTGLILRNSAHRRESFLYRNEAIGDHFPGKAADSSFLQQTEEVYVTPYAQVIASLKRIRNVFVDLTKDNSQPDDAGDIATTLSRKCGIQRLNPIISNNELHDLPSKSKLIADTIAELDWVLEMLDQIQAQRSVSSLTNMKFKRLLSIGLSNTSASMDRDAISPNRNGRLGSIAHPNKESMVGGAIEFSKDECDVSPSNSSATPLTGDSIHVPSTGVARKSSSKAASQISEYIHQFFDPTDDIRIAATTGTPDEVYQLPTSAAPGDLKEIDETDPSSEVFTHPCNSQDTQLNATGKITVLQLNEAIRESELNELNNDPKNTEWKDEDHPSCSQDADVAYNMLLSNNAINCAKLDEMLCGKINNWDFSIFDVELLTPGRTLTVLGYNIFKTRNFMQKFNIPSQVLVNFFQRVESFYRSHVVYHNSTHAADVMQSAHVLLSARCMEEVYSDLEVFSTLFACAVHDVDHPGLTNQFLIKTENTLALLYNDISVLENHHLSVAFGVLQDSPNCDILSDLSRTQRQTFRKMVIDMVLATDMSRHMSLLADLKTTLEAKRASGSSVINLDNYATRILLLQNLVHAADLSNTSKVLPIYLKWVERVTSEFYRQGDQERALGMELSAMCDKKTACVPSSQVSFIDFISYPLWETWCDMVYPDGQEMIENISKNREWFATVSHDDCTHKLKENTKNEMDEKISDDFED